MSKTGKNTTRDEGNSLQCKNYNFSSDESKKRISEVLDKQAGIKKSAEAPMDALRKIRFTF